MRPAPSFVRLFCSAVCSLSVIHAADAPRKDEPPAEKGPVAMIKNSVSAAGDGLSWTRKKVVSGVSGTLSRVSKALGITDPARKKAGAEVKLQVTPAVIQLEKDRRIEVVVKISNSGKRALLLEFPNSQRVDAVMRDTGGAIVARASEDQQFLEEAAVVSVNPGERVEYALSLSTRELKPGQRYTLEVSAANQGNLRATQILQTK